VKIAIVEDDINMRKSLEIALAEYKEFEIETFKSPKDALKKLDESFELVITDINMPGMDGMEFLKELGGRYEAIVITGNATLNRAIESIRLGVKDFLTKPFDVETLVEAIKRSEKAVKISKSKPQNTHKEEHGGEFASSSPALEACLKIAKKAAVTDATVLLLGESGVGKELFANYIHKNSTRAERPFIALNMAAIPENLLESELFGHVKGAFTGAQSSKRGIFDVADGGTLFLDEVSNIPLETQSKLLRVLEEHEIRPLGSETIRKIDIRLIAATNRDLRVMIEREKFREDLYYRLNVFSILLPPLRDRREDIPVLASYFLRQSCGSLGRKINGFSDNAMEILMDYHWPGNVRELKHTVERLVLICDGETLSSDTICDVIDRELVRRNGTVPATNEELKLARKEAREKAIEEIEKKFILEALARSNWNITKAAEETGMQRTHLQALIKKYNIESSSIKE